MNFADVSHINWRAVVDLKHNILDIGNAFEIAAATNEIFRRRNFESFAAHVAVARFHARDDLT